MSMSKVSSIVFSLIFLITILGLCRITFIYIYFRNSVIAKNKLIETVKVSTSDVQDDFRGERFGLLNDYVKRHTLRSIDGSRDLLTNNDKKAILSKYGSAAYTDKAGLFIKNHEGRAAYKHNIYKAYSKNRERIYFYEVQGIYHSSDCYILQNHLGSRKVYSSMEDCAINGAEPCVKCILGY